MISSQDDRNIFFYNMFNPAILDFEKLSHELLTSLMMPPQESGLFLFLYYIIIKEII